ncbi:MAG: lytic transglycosylase domain-containing protein, partial [Sphingomicrobium sp.]
MKVGLIGLGALIWALPLNAQSAYDPLAPIAQPSPTAVQPPPVAALPPPQVAYVPRDWRGVFNAIDAGQWAAAQAGIYALPVSVLTPVAKAQLYTARGSPAVSLSALQALIAEAPDLPQADQLARMAQTRGSTTPLLVVPTRRTNTLGSAPGRYRAKAVAGDPVADQLREILVPYVKANDAAGAEAQFLFYAPQLTLEARAELGQRVAWVYYVLGLDLDARRVSDTWRQGAAGDWASQAAWISALASWRLSDCNSASRAFQQVGQLATQRALKSGGYYWASRAEQMCHRPRSVEPLLRAAADSAESFYGLIALESLGMPTRLPDDSLVAYDPPLEQILNVRRAAELARIGEPALAEELLRHQAKIGQPGEHHALIQTAKRLDLPAAQLWLANNGQPGARSDPADRYPNPKWAPLNGWRVDQALAYGHIIQESSFRRTAVSTAGAVGLMQVLPGTAQMVSRSRGVPYSTAALTDPRYNMEFGQSFIEMMRGSSATAGQLPRVIASYNAGPLPVGRWAAINDKGDPLLWIESIPYYETRYYVPAVLRNMWVYQGLNKEGTPT